jgi:hypothetical protein
MAVSSEFPSAGFSSESSVPDCLPITVIDDSVSRRYLKLPIYPISARGRSAVNELSPPRGWKKLRDLAQNETDPEKLATMLTRLNVMLSKQEKKKASHEETVAHAERTNIIALTEATLYQRSRRRQ